MTDFCSYGHIFHSFTPFFANSAKKIQTCNDRDVDLTSKNKSVVELFDPIFDWSLC